MTLGKRKLLKREKAGKRFVVLPFPVISPAVLVVKENESERIKLITIFRPAAICRIFITVAVGRNCVSIAFVR